MFVRESNALVACPGGFGTMDELFEVITLIQTGRTEPIPIVLLEHEGGSFWDNFITFAKGIVKAGNASENDLALFKKFTDPEQALEYIQNFYKRYHSMDFVGDKLVIRLKEKLPDAILTNIKEKFADFIGEDGLEYSSPLDGEDMFPEIENLPRLVMKADRTKPARLYNMLIALNAD